MNDFFRRLAAIERVHNVLDANTMPTHANVVWRDHFEE